MPAYRKIGGVWEGCTVWRKIAGAWKECAVWRKVGGVWEQITSLMTASASPNNVSGNGDGSSTQTVQSNSTTATPDGGSSPYTYQWTQVSGDTMNIISPISATTSFSADVVVGNFLTASFQCTVTDNLGNTATTNQVTCTLTNGGI